MTESRFGIDFAWGRRPSIAELRAGGVHFVGRYLSHDASKDLSHEECSSYRLNNIGCICAWETSANRALAGETAGREDAEQALAKAKAAGYGGPIFFAVDFDAEGPDVWRYFRGARAVAGSRTGVYGGYRVVRYLFDNGLVSHAWQTYAWSGGQWDRRAAWRQYSNGHSFAGIECDYDVELVEASSPPAPAPGVKLPPSAAVLEPAERQLVVTLLKYEQHPALHPHGIPITKERIAEARKAIWLAAVKGQLPGGTQTQPGWGIRNRAARYRVLWGYS